MVSNAAKPSKDNPKLSQGGYPQRENLKEPNDRRRHAVRRILLVFTVAALMAAMVVSAGPAKADVSGKPITQ